MAGTVVVVNVRLMHVFTEEIIEIGIVGATHGCGLAITPQAAFFLLNSNNHSLIVFSEHVKSDRYSVIMLTEHLHQERHPLSRFLI